MKSTALFKTCFITIAVAITLSFASTGMAQRVLAANVTAKGRFQTTKTVNSNGNPVDLDAIKSTPAITSKGLINLALGNDSSTPVPANYTLAVIVCTDNTLVVYDKIGQNIVTTIADIDRGPDENTLNTGKLINGVAVDTGLEGLATLNFQNVGNTNHAINGGSVKVYFKGTRDNNGDCPNKIVGSGIGTIDVTVPVGDGNGNEVPTQIHVLLSSFKVSTSTVLVP